MKVIATLLRNSSLTCSREKPEFCCCRERLGLCISKIYLDLKLRYDELYHIQVNTVTKMAR